LRLRVSLKGIPNAKNHYFSSLNSDVIRRYTNMALQHELGICTEWWIRLAVLDSGHPVVHGQNLRLTKAYGLNLP